MRVNIFVRGALFPHWTRKRSGGVVASVSVGVPWTGRVGPSGLVWTGCRERVGLDALDRTSRPEWVGPEGLLRACRLGCLGLDESTRMGWLGGVVVSVSVWMPWSGRVDPNGLVRTGCRERVGWDALGRPSRPEWVGPCTVWIRSFWFETAVPCPLFPCASGRCLPCFVPLVPPCTRALPSCASDCCLPCFVSLSPMPRPHLLVPGRCLPVLRTAAFRALFHCLLCLARSSYASPVPPMPRPFLLAPRSLPPVAHGPLLSVHGPALSCSSARSFLPFGLHSLTPSCTLHPPAPLPTLFCASARFLLLSSLCPRSSPCKRKPPKAWPSGVFGYCRSRITSQEPSG